MKDGSGSSAVRSVCAPLRNTITDGRLVICGDLWAQPAGVKSGEAYIFCADCEGTSTCISQPNSTGSAARILTCGDTSIAANDFQLIALSVPNQPYLYYFGPTQAQVPFGNGTRCVAGATTRVSPAGMAQDQAAHRRVDLPSFGITTPGTLYFQCWFRDTAAGGAGFDLSDAIEVVFQP